MQEAEIVAALGPTNTGKTHRAIVRMLEHHTGTMGLPLRLLAREVYDRVASLVDRESVALITGEEKLVPPKARYFICTVEAMPIDLEVEFLAVDEIQLAEHRERGHVFTDRLLHARGTLTTWFMGSDTMLPLVRHLVPTARHAASPRLSTLHAETTFSLGSLPPRSAVVGFSADRVYELAEKLKGRRGGAAVVLGALSPRARNAQVALYQEGDVDYLVATDAIGMGLNLDLDRVVFADTQKFDGRELRPLELAEIGQIAGRAGRYQRDGAFGAFLRPALPTSVQWAISEHRYPPVRSLTWRNSDLDFSSNAALLASLHLLPKDKCLRLVSHADDSAALKLLLEDPEVRSVTGSTENLKLLWEVCQIPDYRKLLIEQHVHLLKEVYLELLAKGELGPEFLLPRIERLLSHPGDIDAILGRIKSVRTYCYVANQTRWIGRRPGMADRARAVEDQLSDALHQALLQRFVERRKTYSLARSPQDLSGPSSFAKDLLALHTALREATHVPTALDTARFAPPEAFEVTLDGQVMHAGVALAVLRAGRTPLEPGITPIDTHGSALAPEKLLAVLDLTLGKALGGFLARAEAPESGPRRGILYQLREGFGAAEASQLAPLFEALSPAEQKAFQSQGLIVGREKVFLRSQLKPAAIVARLPLLRAYYFAKGSPRIPFEALRHTPLDRSESAGRPALPRGTLPTEVWHKLGYVVAGPCALRIDVYERLLAEASEGQTPGLRRKVASVGQLRAREAALVARVLVSTQT